MGFNYNQDSGMKAGGVIRETGAYTGVISSADYKRANTGSVGLELSLTTKDGAEFNYLTLYYQKKDGTEIKGGASMINAIMGLTGVNQLSEKMTGVNQQTNAQEFCAPELEGQGIGFLLQKVLYTKNNGEDGYKFEIRLPFDPTTRQTLKEKLSNQAPEMVDRMASTLADKDERTKQAPMQSGGFGQQAPQQSFGQPQPNVPEVPDDAFDQQPQGGFGR